ncbi:MAG: molybdenum cofactor biosynthesis protein [Chitinivibrionales bacterium]|nr:molybdenum cofactor biosynthesis protein [Chitinivibrionales bacterium]MBD3394502.1 molybdenum cofactor biosynthesis protein [Chitinivibrionales bacterium]
MKILVLTVSDSASRGARQDLAGPHIEKVLLHHFPEAAIARFVAADDAAEIRRAFDEHADAEFVFTTGGTGISPRDITPDVTAEYCERLIPGIPEMLRAESCKQTPYAALSRAVAGIHGTTIIVNLPGSLKGALLCTRLLIPIIGHAAKMLAGEGHESYEPGALGLGSKDGLGR